MSRSNRNNVRLKEEILDSCNEFRAVLESHDFDMDECEADEPRCAKTHGEDMFRIYQLIKEIEELAS